MLDFVRACCQKDASQRSDSAFLSSHPFVRQDVIALRAMHQGEVSTADADARAKYRKLADTQNRKLGLPAIRRVMDRMRKKMERVKKKRGDEQSDSKSADVKTVDSGSARSSRHSAAGSNGPMGPLDLSNQATVAMHPSGRVDFNTQISNGYGVGVFTPDTLNYGSQASVEFDPVLANDEQFKQDLEKLSRVFETRLAALRTAHELAQQKLIADARIRNQLPMDVTDLMEQAFKGNIKDEENRRALEDAKDVPVIKDVIIQKNASKTPSVKTTPPRGRQSPIDGPPTPQESIPEVPVEEIQSEEELEEEVAVVAALEKDDEEKLVDDLPPPAPQPLEV
jgi:hypothetical protein